MFPRVPRPKKWVPKCFVPQQVDFYVFCPPPKKWIVECFAPPKGGFQVLCPPKCGFPSVLSPKCGLICSQKSGFPSVMSTKKWASKYFVPKKWVSKFPSALFPQNLGFSTCLVPLKAGFQVFLSPPQKSGFPIAPKQVGFHVFCPQNKGFPNVLPTQATVEGSPFGPFISVARGHSRE